MSKQLDSEKQHKKSNFFRTRDWTAYVALTVYSALQLTWLFAVDTSSSKFFDQYFYTLGGLFAWGVVVPIAQMFNGSFRFSILANVICTLVPLGIAFSQFLLFVEVSAAV